MCRLLSTICFSLALSASAVAQLDIGLGGDFGGGFGGTSSAGVQVSADVKPVDGTTVDLIVTATVPEHHYLYSATTPFGIASSISVEKPFKVVGKMIPDRKPKVVHDKIIKVTMEKFFDTVTWTVRVQKTEGVLTADEVISGKLTGQYCSEKDKTCLEIRPPAEFQVSLPSDFKAPVSVSVPALQSTVHIIPEIRRVENPPVSFTVGLTPENPAGGETVRLSVTAKIEAPYHIYATTQPAGDFSQKPTAIALSSVNGLQPIGTAFSADHSPEDVDIAGVKTRVHHDSVTWSREYVLEGDSGVVQGTIEFQVCTGGTCLPRTTTPFTVATAGGTLEIATAGTAEGKPSEASDFGGGAKNGELVPFIISALTAGFLALLTPCVFPMIPVTVSYFLKQGQDRPGSSLRLATIYCLGIVGAFTVLGLLMAVVVGPTAINQLANNPWLNLVFAGVFIVFALMLMGMFEIQLPSWLLTWSSRNQEGGGVLGVLFMALTFTLVSFTCTFAFVGSLLVWASRGDYFMPIIGMVAFSTAFASPFFLLALFPRFLQKLPKSGGWMNSVKVTLGLAELAIVTKFLSVADIGFSASGTPQFLDYHLVMGSWIAVAVVTSMYLLNVFRMPHDSPNESVGPLKCLFSIGFFGLAAYIAVGLFSARSPDGILWQQIVAFAPPQIELSADEDGYFIEHDGLKYALDFDEAQLTAAAENKLMFLDFTGVNCINCRLMENNVLSTQAVHSVIEDLVRVQLYVDEVPGVKSNPAEHKRVLNRNHELQSKWFGDVSIPAYVIVTPDGEDILATFTGLDSTTGTEFQRFLTAGLETWTRRQEAAVADLRSPAESSLLESGSPLPTVNDMKVGDLDYFLNYEEAMAAAEQKSKPVFVNFTGAHCLSPRLVEKNVLSSPEASVALNGVVRLQVYIDQLPGGNQTPKAQERLEKNQELLKIVAGEFAVPYFALLSPDGDVLATQADPQGQADFSEFIQRGAARWNQRKALMPDRPVMKTSYSPK